MGKEAWELPNMNKWPWEFEVKWDLPKLHNINKWSQAFPTICQSFFSLPRFFLLVEALFKVFWNHCVFVILDRILFYGDPRYIIYNKWKFQRERRRLYSGGGEGRNSWNFAGGIIFLSSADTPPVTYQWKALWLLFYFTYVSHFPLLLTFLPRADLF